MIGKTVKYKGKGEHSVRELEIIIEQQAEELHLIKSGQKKLSIHDVSVRDFIVGDVVCTQDGRIWVINEINGNDLLVDGNGRENYPLEKHDVSHLH